MKIANPSYDTVFKYLMQDLRAARIIISAILKRKIKDLKQVRNDVPVSEVSKPEWHMNLLRLDYTAVIVGDDGKERAVCIELQRMKEESEVRRFRRYLGAYYQDQSLVGNDNQPLPIVVIYILGHLLPNIKVEDKSVLYVKPSVTDYDGGEVKIDGTENFIDGLTHEMAIVLLPNVKRVRPGGILEALMSLFDYGRNKEVLEIDDRAKQYTLTTEDESDVMWVQARLSTAVAERDVQQVLEMEMQGEEMYIQWLENNRAKEEMSKEIEKITEEKKKITEEKMEMKGQMDKMNEEKKEMKGQMDKMNEEKKEMEGKMDKMREKLRAMLIASGMTEKEAKREMGE